MARFAFLTVAVSAMLSSSISAALEVTSPAEGDMVKADRCDCARRVDLRQTFAKGRALNRAPMTAA